MIRRALAILSLTASVATAGVVAGYGSGVSAASDVLPSVTGVTATVSGTTITVAWTASGEPSDVVYVVGLTDPYEVGMTTRVCTGCSSITWSGLRANMTYQTAVAPWSPSSNAWGYGVGAAKVTTTDALCAAHVSSGHACLGVDASTNAGTEAHPGSGFLHGITTATSTATVASLAPTSWRVAALDPNHEAPAAKTGAALTLILSDAWYAQTYSSSRGAPASPWSDWAAYTAFVKRTVQTEEAAGRSNAYWDVQNEPENPNNYDPAAPATTANVLQQYLVAYNAIKAVDPNAKIVGPSIGYNFNNTSYVLDMRRFLDFAAANGMHLDALSWHEDIDGGPMNAQPAAIADHVAEVRGYLARYPALGSPQIFINEYAGAAGGLVPGWIVSYLATLDRAGVAQANHSCFHASCGATSSVIDGLLTSSGATTASGVAYQTYAAMSGRRLTWTSGDDHVDAVATADASGVVHLLLGRSQVCPSWAASGCPSSTSAPAAQTIDLAVGGLGSATSVTVQTGSLPSSSAALSAVKAGTTQTVTVTNGVAKVSLAGLADGSALVVTVTPSAGGSTTLAAPRRH